MWTPHGYIDTPVFMPVGTQAAVKGVLPDQLVSLGSQIILSNTYHLALRPGSELIQAAGGLHAFMQWDRPILTDSGGYQVFSLQSQRTIDADGVVFKSHLDGSRHRFTPQTVVDHQVRLGSDIMMPLDICTPYGATKAQTAADMAITHRWEADAARYWHTLNTDQLLFGLVQGGMYDDLRQESVAAITQHAFSGFAIGGVSVGEPMADMHRIIETVTPQLPPDKPRYIMGIGLPENLEVAIRSGADMFDCVLPTRLARHGQVFMAGHQRVSLKQARFKLDPEPIQPGCDCYTCMRFSRGYLRHLIHARELSAATLLSIHNLRYLIRLVDTIRNQIG